MPPSYSPCPRPILKRASTACHATQQPRDEPGQLLDIDPSILQPLVRFPPTPTLTRTFTAHSPSAYDRSPIVVTPNRCSLPERGCPGRTYLPDARHRTDRTAPRAYGKHLHPSAVAASACDDDDDDDPTPRATPTLYQQPLPPLIPDLSSSESDSDSFPPELICTATHNFYPPPYSIPRAPAGADPASTSAPKPSPLAFVAHSPRTRSFAAVSPTRSSRRRSSPSARRTHRDRSRERDRAPSSPSSPVDSSPKYKSLSEYSRLTSCAALPDLGCLGGF